MRLLERVSTLIRANLNDMVDRAEDPEKLIKQIILDMENQYLQVKTQVAVSIADQHMLEKKLRENVEAGSEWMRKAELAVDKSQDELARAALDRFQTSQKLALSYREQVEDQTAQVETLKTSLVKLEQKLNEAKAKRDLLIARHRRSNAMGKAARAHTALGDQSKSAAFDHQTGLEQRIAGVFGDPCGHQRILVVGMILGAPGVEGEHRSGAPAVAVHDIGGARVAQPGIVDGQHDDPDRGSAAGAGVGLLVGIDDHADRFEAADGLRHPGVVVARGIEIPAPERGPFGPCHPAACMRGPFSRHQKSKIRGPHGRQAAGRRRVRGSHRRTHRGMEQLLFSGDMSP